jgi:hypothetical protein
MVFAHGLLAGFPTAALGALVVYAAVRLIDLAGFRRLAKFRRSELILAVLTAAAVLTLGVLYGVLAAVGLSILDLLRRVARPHDSVLGFVPGVAGMHDIEDYPHARLEPGLLIYRYDAPLFFANVASGLGQIQSGRLRPLAVTAATRCRALPDVPTMAEAGITDLNLSAWMAFLAPAKTPRSIIDLLNRATQAWVEQEYHRSKHSEINATPLQHYLAGPNVARVCPSSETLQNSFRVEVVRRQRRSDGTVSLDGVRFEIASSYRTLEQVHLRYARWDLSRVDLVDARTGAILCQVKPLDKSANASGQRRRLAPLPVDLTPLEPKGLPALLIQLLSDYAATGLPPAYLPMPTVDTTASTANPDAQSSSDGVSP